MGIDFELVQDRPADRDRPFGHPELKYVAAGKQ